MKKGKQEHYGKNPPKKKLGAGGGAIPPWGKKSSWKIVKALSNERDCKNHVIVLQAKTG